MLSAKEELKRDVEQMSEEQAKQLLEHAKLLLTAAAMPSTLQRLSLDPTYRVPKTLIKFRTVVPVEGKGIAASQLLVEARR